MGRDARHLHRLRLGVVAGAVVLAMNNSARSGREINDAYAVEIYRASLFSRFLRFMGVRFK